MMTATYSPEDNKLRLYSVARLDTDTYARMRAAGFIYAPQQKLFVAPKWTPEREDLLLDLCDGEIGDDDTSLVDRAMERAERFDDYRDSRLSDAEQAHATVSRITDGIPLGQPILVGHHSERHARKDQERIENGMRRAVKMWDTAQYWKSRAAGALHHAKYKLQPDVRHRRIKGLEADQRKHQTRADDAARFIRLWRAARRANVPETPESDTRTRVLAVLNVARVSLTPTPERPYRWSAWSEVNDGHMTVRDATLIALKQHGRTIADARRWLVHLANRLTYERAMLEESGGLGITRANIPVQVGGQVRVRNEWLTVLRLNRKDGVLVSVTTAARYCRVKGIEEIAEVRPPDPERVAAVKAVTSKPTLCNYPGEGFETLTRAEWDRLYSDGKGTQVIDATPTHGAHRVRKRWQYRGGVSQHISIFVSDLPRKEAPSLAKAPRRVPVDRAVIAPELDIRAETTRLHASNERRAAEQEEAAPFEALRQAAKTGVSVVVAPQLFPTPAPLARRMGEEADIHPGMRVLEPSAGTGCLIPFLATQGHNIVAVEVNSALAHALRVRFTEIAVHCADFLQLTADAIGGRFDRIVMNPPFRNGEDVAHIRHALRFLKPGGRLVAVCAQRAEFGTLADLHNGTYEPLPEGTFAEQGTGVRVALLVLDAPDVDDAAIDTRVQEASSSCGK